MRSNIVHYLIVPFIIIILFSAQVVAIPPMPTEFYGSIFVDGKPAPTGTVISAQINGVEKGSINTTVDGFYGGPGIFDDRLKVYVKEEEYRPGELKIVFLINGVQASQTVDYEPGISKQLDLSTGGSGLTQGMAQQPVSLITPNSTNVSVPSSIEEPSTASPGVSKQFDLSTGGSGLTQGMAQQPVSLITPNSTNVSVPSSIQESSYSSPGPSSGSSTVSYGLDQPRSFKSEDGLADVQFAKDTMLFSPEGQFLNAIGLRSKNIADLPPVPAGQKLRFSGYAYEIIPQGTYFNPKGVLTLRLPPERAFAIISAKPTIYEYLAQTASWEPVTTRANAFTNEISGDIFEAGIFGLFMPAELSVSNQTTTNTPSSSNVSPVPLSTADNRTAVLPIITPQSIITPQTVITPIQEPTVVPTTPVITAVVTMTPVPEQTENHVFSIIPKIPGLGFIGSLVTTIKVKLSGPVIAVLSTIAGLIILNYMVFVIYRFWWQKRGRNG